MAGLLIKAETSKRLSKLSCTRRCLSIHPVGILLLPQIGYSHRQPIEWITPWKWLEFIQKTKLARDRLAYLADPVAKIIHVQTERPQAVGSGLKISQIFPVI